eukprot:gene22517-28650_t
MQTLLQNALCQPRLQQDHAQYALTYGMMLGIRVTTGRAAFYNMERNYQMKHHLAQSNQPHGDSEERELTQEDFDYALELAFPPEGTTNAICPTPPHKLKFTFKFKDYMSNAFRAVRSLSGIDEADYMMSLAGDFNYIEFIANSKSGQFFFYSHDGKYMIKTQTQEESVLLRQIMPQYVAHLNKHPDSLLVRVKMKSLRSKIHFVIMSSVFDTEKSIQVKYDLKGSTIGRLTDAAACANGAVQKDLNLMNSGRKLCFGPENVKLFRDTLHADCMFLRDLNIMDYSLLVGIHEKGASGVKAQRRRSSVILSKSTSMNEAALHANTHANANSDHDSSNVSVFTQCSGGIASTRSANAIYFVGIIDILQLYNTGKKLETFFKGFTNDRRQLSSVDPSSYADRMMEFVLRHTDYKERFNPVSSEDAGEESDTSHGRRGSGGSANGSFSDADGGNGGGGSDTEHHFSTPVKLTAQQIALQKLEGKRPPERATIQPFAGTNGNNNSTSSSNQTPPRQQPQSASQKINQQKEQSSPTPSQRASPQRSASVSCAPNTNNNTSSSNGSNKNSANTNGQNGNNSPSRGGGILKPQLSSPNLSTKTDSTSSKMNGNANGSSAKGSASFAQNSSKDKRRDIV